MTESLDRQKLAELIRDQIRAAKDKIKAIEDGAGSVSLDNPVGRLSRMDSLVMKEVSDTTLRQERERLARLQRAAARVDEPEFGICLSCREPIPIKRLLLMPESTECVACQS